MRTVALQLPAELVEELRREARDAGAAAARAVVEALPVPASAPQPLPVVRYARIADYAHRVGLSSRKVHDLITRGLPTIGSGRLRRVDVDPADAWLAEHLDD